MPRPNRFARRWPARGEGGFTLVEVLAAMGVLSIALVALIDVQGEEARTTRAVEERVIAGFVAENRLAEAMLSTAPAEEGERCGDAEMAGRRWNWTESVTPAPIKGLYRVRVSVRAAGGGEILAELDSLKREGTVK